jgi:hypothetical protein
MTNREIKVETKGHKIFEGKSSFEGYKDGDKIAIAFESRNHGTLHHFYTLGSVVGSSIKNCECPFEGVERANKFGHDLHWANQNSTMICSGPSDQTISFMQRHGDLIKFHGKMFEVIKTANNNIALQGIF